MQKLLYLTTWDFKDGPSTGITKKILAQMKAFKEYGFNVDYTYIADNKVYFCQDGKSIPLGKVGRLRKLAANFFLWKKMREKKYSYVYSRYGLADLYYIKLLKEFSIKGSKIIVEIPTYPYDDERLPGVVWWLLYTMDRIFRKKLKYVVDYVATYSSDEKIFGIPTVKVCNGIDFSAITLRNPKNQSDEIRLIAVAALARWHGYDRLLEGLGQYYQGSGERKIIFHIVGDGPVKKEYEEIVKRYGLQNHVIFYGMVYGQDLDGLYDMCDIGVENLGFHRCGVTYSSTLKSREYGAKGLPFITSCIVDVFNGLDFVLKVPANDEMIDIEKIVKFYDMMYNKAKNTDVCRVIRAAAEERCSMEKVIKPIVEAFDE